MPSDLTSSPHVRSRAARTSFLVGATVCAVGGLSAWRQLPTAAAGVPRPASLPPEHRPVVVRPAASWVVYGVVRDASTRLPLEGVAITVSGTTVSASTNRQGHYRLPVAGLTRGASVRLMVRRLGYAAHSETVLLSADSTRIDVALAAQQQTLSAVAVQADATHELSVANRAMVRPAVAAGGTAAPPPASAAAVGKARVQPAESRRAYQERDRVRRDSSRTTDWNREQYERITDNPFLAVTGNPRSTFSVDVDRSSYGNVRRFLTQGQLPPADAVRIEELVNYFPYSLPTPRGDAPVAITLEGMPAPWQPRHHLVRVALQARRIDVDRLPPSNLVFLVDVSGSMMSADKLPLVKQSLRLLVEQLRPQDRVALVAYAGAAGLVLPSTSGEDKARIMEAIDRLEAGGSTAGGAGLELAYRTARDHFERGGNNRVILATDGDFNVGPSSDAAMERLIESKRAEGTYLTILGFGTGNYQDAKMQKLARVGNGNAAYVDDIAEARKVLVKEMGGTLVTVANDVKLQVEFNPARVASYRLIGYEDRLLRDEDFRDDKKDAGDMGAGHAVTALYEVVPVGVRGTVTARESDPLRYGGDVESRPAPASSDELLHVSLRYKRPGESTSRLISKALHRGDVRERASDDLRFAAAVASFGMLLRDSEHKGNATAASVLSLARSAAGDDEEGYRGEFIDLVERWRSISRGVANRPEGRDPR